MTRNATLVVGLCALGITLACASTNNIGPIYDEVAHITSAGQTVYVLRGLERHPDLVRRVLDRVRKANTPLELTGHVWQSGAFPWESSPTGFAVGAINLQTGHYWVALRTNNDQLIPALEHELAHWRTKDLLIGHK